LRRAFHEKHHAVGFDEVTDALLNVAHDSFGRSGQGYVGTGKLIRQTTASWPVRI
jgi:hypothetical protein